MAWRTAVKAIGEQGFSYNSLVFTTREEADDYGRNLHGRWMGMDSWEPEEINEPVNYIFVDGQLKEMRDGR